jgi:hypothetical protein
MTSDDVPAFRDRRTGTAPPRHLSGGTIKAIGFFRMHHEFFDPYPDTNPRLTPYPGSRTFVWDPNQIKGEIQGTPSPRLLYNFMVGKQQYFAAYRAQESAPDAPRTLDNVTSSISDPVLFRTRVRGKAGGRQDPFPISRERSVLGRHELKGGFAWMYQDYATGRLTENTATTS